MKPYTIADFRRDYRYGPYAWPGGYPRYFVCCDGEPLSFAAVRENLRLILGAIHDRDESGWHVVGCEINWEDEALFCAHTAEKIEPAYAHDGDDREIDGQANAPLPEPEDKPVPGVDDWLVRPAPHITGEPEEEDL